jgi:hypothetical protein
MLRIFFYAFLPIYTSLLQIFFLQILQPVLKTVSGSSEAKTNCGQKLAGKLVQLESGERDSKNYFLTYSTLKHHSGSTVVMKDTLDNARDVSKGYTWRINQVA